MFTERLGGVHPKSHSLHFHNHFLHNWQVLKRVKTWTCGPGWLDEPSPLTMEVSTSVGTRHSWTAQRMHCLSTRKMCLRNLGGTCPHQPPPTEATAVGRGAVPMSPRPIFYLNCSSAPRGHVLLAVPTFFCVFFRFSPHSPCPVFFPCRFCISSSFALSLVFGALRFSISFFVFSFPFPLF